MRVSLPQILVLLLLLCVWLGVMTHYALSVIAEAQQQDGSNERRRDVEPHHSDDSDRKKPPSIVSGNRVALESLQLSLLKRSLDELRRERNESDALWAARLQRIELQLAACRKNEALARAQGNQRAAEGIRRPPPPVLTTQPRSPAVPEPSFENEYAREQWRIKEYMRKQRQQMLSDRRDFVDRQKAPLVAPEDAHGASSREQPLTLDQVEHLDSVARSKGPMIAVVIVAYKRTDELRKCVENILRRMPHFGFQLFASQDGTEFPEVTSLLSSYAASSKLVHLVHERNASGGTEEEIMNGWEPYFAISHHYQFFLTQIFSVPAYQRVIIIEEDVEVGVDFFDYMTALSPLLDQDPSLFCISAWNDNGKASLIIDPRQLYRTDFFPGLGWMMSRALWQELQPKWPAGFWDDWLRQPKNRQGRACIRPEVPRSFTWCTSEGVSQGQFCAEHLSNIKLADTAINWKAQDLSYLVKDHYDQWIGNIIEQATEIRAPDELERVHAPDRRTAGAMSSPFEPLKEVKLLYHSNEEFEHYAQLLMLMEDFKDNVPRTAYKGIVSFRRRSLRVHLVPSVPLYE